LILTVDQIKQDLQATTVEKQETLAKVEEEKAKSIQELTKHNEEVVEKLEMERQLLQQDNSRIQQTKENELSLTKQNYEDAITKLKQEHEIEINNLKKAHEEEMKKYKQIMELKIDELKDTIQKLNDLLPERDIKEGFLTKQGGGHKNWKKRYFVLKTNFMCYYKDNKNLKHPQGVIDLNDSKITRVDKDEVKKNFVFQIVTAKRTYLCKADSDEDVDSWIGAIERARATFKTDIQIRKTFLERKSETNE